jgi:hypothetical protein
VVATLLEVLLTHDRVNAAIEHALKHRDVPPAQVGDGDDLQTSIESAALLDARLTAVEWAQVSLVALQGTQVSSLILLDHAVNKFQLPQHTSLRGLQERVFA